MTRPVSMPPRARRRAAVLTALGILGAAPAAAQTAATDPPALAAAAPAPTAREPDPPMRVELGVVGTIVGLFGSRFADEAARWGYNGMGVGGGFATEAGVHLDRYVMVGARVGYLGGGSNRSRQDRQGVGLSLFDVSGVLRFSLPLVNERGSSVALGAQLEAGAAQGTHWLRGESAASPLIPRVAGQLMLTAYVPHVALGTRLGYQTATWRNAGGPDIDLGFTGLFYGLSLEVGL